MFPRISGKMGVVIYADKERITISQDWRETVPVDENAKLKGRRGERGQRNSCPFPSVYRELPKIPIEIESKHLETLLTLMLLWSAGIWSGYLSYRTGRGPVWMVSHSLWVGCSVSWMLVTWDRFPFIMCYFKVSLPAVTQRCKAWDPLLSLRGELQLPSQDKLLKVDTVKLGITFWKYSIICFIFLLKFLWSLFFLSMYLFKTCFFFF